MGAYEYELMKSMKEMDKEIAVLTKLRPGYLFNEKWKIYDAALKKQIGKIRAYKKTLTMMIKQQRQFDEMLDNILT